MYKKYIAISLICASGFVVGCTAADMQTAMGNGSAVSTNNNHLAQTDPNKVKLYYGNQNLPPHYKIIGHISAANYNLVGVPHSESSIAEELRREAASIGGKGVMNITTGLDRTTGDVVIY